MNSHIVNYGQKRGLASLVWEPDRVKPDEIFAFWLELVQPDTFHIAPQETKITKMEVLKLQVLLERRDKILPTVEATIGDSLPDKLDSLSRLAVHMTAKVLGVQSQTYKRTVEVVVNCHEVGHHGSLRQAIKAKLDGRSSKGKTCGCHLIPSRVRREYAHSYYDDPAWCNLSYREAVKVNLYPTSANHTLRMAVLAIISESPLPREILELIVSFL